MLTDLDDGKWADKQQLNQQLRESREISALWQGNQEVTRWWHKKGGNQRHWEGGSPGWRGNTRLFASLCVRSSLPLDSIIHPNRNSGLSLERMNRRNNGLQNPRQSSGEKSKTRVYLLNSETHIPSPLLVAKLKPLTPTSTLPQIKFRSSSPLGKSD